jgi:hypothetical protein
MKPDRTAPPSHHSPALSSRLAPVLTHTRSPALPASPARVRSAAPSAATLALAILVAAGPLAAQEYPSVEISNGSIDVMLYLPDAEAGYYRGTRFEWGGVFGRLEYGGRNYAARWYEPHDPNRHDSLGGPIQEFVQGGWDNSGLGYAEARAGETFVKIGVGVLRKPEENGYRFTQTYDIVDPGKWTITREANAVTFTQDLSDPRTGYAYSYAKTVRLVPGEPKMILEHTLRNVGTRTIETSVYNHNFLVMDDRPSGPEIALHFPFELNATGTGPRPLLDVQGGRLSYQRPLEGTESVRYEFDGFGSDVANHDIRVESAGTGRGIRITGDRPLSHFVYWSVPAVISPETYIRMTIEPGRDFSWNSAYTFYETAPTRSR